MAFIRSQPAKKFAKNSIMIYQGEAPTALFAIRSGFVKIHDVSTQGTDETVWFAKKYDFIPLDWLFGKNQAAPFFYTAFTDTEAYVVSKAAFLDFVKDRNDVLLAIIDAIVDKQAALLRHLNAVQKSKASEKVLYTLQFIASRYSADERQEDPDVTLPLTHQDIADLVGLTRETTAIELKRLKDDGIIDYSSTSFLIYTDKLADLLV